MHLRPPFICTAAMILCSMASAPALAIGGLADLTIVDRSSGEAMAVHYYRGDYWVAGRPGAKYAVSVCNRDGGRVLGVVSVDGVNVLSGKTAATQQSGYVFGNRSCTSITGWRKSDTEVAAFEFSASSDSYAALTGRPGQVGVIGVALFREKLPEPVVYAPESLAPAAPERLMAPSAAESGMRQKQSSDATERAQAQNLAAPKLGTAHGQREQSYVSHTNFERAQASPNEIIRIRYDSRESLVAMGVIRAPQRIPASPNPFPVAEYTPDPPARLY